MAGAMDVAMNAYAVALERVMGRPILSGLHGAWSAGMLASGAIALVAVAGGVGPATQFTVLGIGCAVASAIALRGLEDIPVARPSASAERVVHLRTVLLSTVLLGLIGFGAFVVEGADMDWGQIYLQDEQVAIEAVVEKLRLIAQNNPDRRIFVRGDKDLAYGRIMEVMGTITQGGFTKVALLAEQRSTPNAAPASRPASSPAASPSAAPPSAAPNRPRSG